MAPPDSRPMSHSVGTITTIVMPHMQNVLGDLFGGNLMAMVDQAAAVAAIRHAGNRAVTASIDRVDFRERIPVGSLVTCEARVDFVGNTSMDISVEVYAETVSTGERRHTHSAHVVFVAIDAAWEADAGAAARARDRRGAGALCASGGAPAEQAVDVIPRGVTVVLSGGGAKTAAHLGAMRALEEHGLAPARYVATSMGAVIAAGLAAGVAASVLLERLTLVGRRGIVRDPVAPVLGLFARSLLRPAPFRRAVEALVPARRFGELRVPLTVSVVDLDTGELLLLGAGGFDAPLVDVLCATCALPLYFPPVSLVGRRCGDGGLRGVLPLESAARVAHGARGRGGCGPRARHRAGRGARGAARGARARRGRRHPDGGPHRGPARGLAREPGASFAGLRPATHRAERDLPGRADAAIRRGRLSGRARALDHHPVHSKLSHMRASEAMVGDPHVAVAGAMASEVAIMLRTRNISVVPVVDDHRTRRFLGTLSDRDLVTRCLAEGKHPWHTRSDALMRTNSPVVRADQELTGYKVRMDLDPNESHLRPTITVVDGDGCVIGFISHPEQVPGVEIVWG